MAGAGCVPVVAVPPAYLSVEKDTSLVSTHGWQDGALGWLLRCTYLYQGHSILPHNAPLSSHLTKHDMGPLY